MFFIFNEIEYFFKKNNILHLKIFIYEVIRNSHIKFPHDSQNIKHRTCLFSTNIIKHIFSMCCQYTH